MITKILLCFATVAILDAQTGPDAEIKAVLYRQQAAWNRGDTETFLTAYDAKTVFVGDKVTRGLDEVRVRYQTRYPTVASMGHLTFSDIEVHVISIDHAYVIGHFHLDRTPEAGGDTGGFYTLLLRKTAAGWKIILDHTS
jgi:uncharacterized protein (TIGR02246 family)